MSELVHDARRLKELQALPLHRKIQITQARVIEWFQHYGGKVCVSFSGGKDSTVLLHICRKLYPNIPAVFSNTGLEYPEIQSFVKKHDNVKIVRPKIQFSDVISTYGYPLIGKETAEAIYYARRIRFAERERERPSIAEWNSSAHGSEADGISRETEAKRTEFQGRRKRGGRAGVNGKTGEGGVFSNQIEQIGEKSQFNKEKYLPLARDIPVPISHYCCNVMKKQPLKQFQKQVGLYPILATMADESRIRTLAWIRTGCNAFDGASPLSKPMSFWTEQDVLQYIVENNIEIAPVYGDVVAVDEVGNEYEPNNALIQINSCKLRCTGCERTGCMFCAFGFHNEKGKTRFQRLAFTHPRQYEYCMRGGQWVDNPAYDATAPEYDGEWKNWNPKKIWVPSKDGLGMRAVFDMVNEIYGKNFYRYE